MLSNLFHNSCPKCVATRGRLEEFRLLSHNTQPENQCAPERLDTEARDLRTRFRRGKLTRRQLNALDYHPSHPFSVNYPFGGILDALSPDLLHQASKCFMDHITEKFLLPLTKSHWEAKGISEAALLTELDLRFMYMTPYPGLRRFSDGVYTQDHHWTMREYKDIMRVNLGVLHGLCPPEGISLLREYIHIHRLSHYPAHTDESLSLLDAAIHTFWRILKNPDGALCKYLLHDDWSPMKLHFFSHYARAITEKGSLPACSTDRTEPYHKSFKESFQASNKGQGADIFILRRDAQWTAMERLVEKVEGKSQSQQNSRTLMDVPRVGVEECSDSENEADDDDDTFQPGAQQVRTPPNPFTTADKVPKHNIVWPARSRHNRPASIRATADLLRLSTFESSMRSFIQKLPTHNRWNPLGLNWSECGGDLVGSTPVVIFNSITLEYYVNAVWGADISGRFAAAWDTNRMVRDKITAGPEGGLRRDSVLIRFPETQDRQRNFMSGRKVGRVQIFFKHGDDRRDRKSPGDTCTCAKANSQAMRWSSCLLQLAKKHIHLCSLFEPRTALLS
jgi:hypothetical protein